MILPGTAAIPAVHADRLRAAEATGARRDAARRASELTPDRIVTAAIGRERAARAARDRRLDQRRHAPDRDRRPRRHRHRPRSGSTRSATTTPVLVDLKPTGPHYMEDLFAAGGIGAVLRELQPLLHLDCLTVTGETLGERLAAPAGPVDRAVVKPLAEPLQPMGGLVALFGSLAPKGAIFKRSAADPEAVRAARAARSCSPRSRISSARIDDPELDVDPGRFPGAAERRPAVGLGHAGGRLSADPGKSWRAPASRTWCASPTRG